jgi:hypothetical protein
MALNMGLGASYDNMSDWKVILDEAGEVSSAKAYGLNGENFLRALHESYT